MRRRLLTSAAVLALSAGAAFASDLPTHKPPPPPPPPPVFSWTGFYVGVNGGYADPTSKISVVPGGKWVGDLDQANVTAAGTDKLGLHGFTGGAQLGYNYQINNLLVLGAEADANYLGLHNSYATPDLPGSPGGYWASGATKLDSLFTLRGRVGLPVDHFLFYLTGGLAITDEKFSQSINFQNNSHNIGLPLTNGFIGANAGSASSTVATWTLGGGVEYAFDSHWSVKGEYLYAPLKSLGFSSSYTSPISGPPAYTMQHNDSLTGLNVFRIGLNYRM